MVKSGIYHLLHASYVPTDDACICIMTSNGMSQATGREAVCIYSICPHVSKHFVVAKKGGNPPPPPRNTFLAKTKKWVSLEASLFKRFFCSLQLSSDLLEGSWCLRRRHDHNTFQAFPATRTFRKQQKPVSNWGRKSICSSPTPPCVNSQSIHSNWH